MNSEYSSLQKNICALLKIVSVCYRYLFLCEDWLSLNRGTCKTYRMLQLSSRDELLQVKRMFKKRARSLFVEDNLWVSLPTKAVPCSAV